MPKAQQDNHGDMNARSPAELLATAITEIGKRQELDTEGTRAPLNSTPFPPTVPTGDGPFVITSRDGMQALHDLAQGWRANSISAKQH